MKRELILVAVGLLAMTIQGARPVVLLPRCRGLGQLFLAEPGLLT